MFFYGGQKEECDMFRYHYKKLFNSHVINFLWYFWIEFNRYGFVFGIKKSSKSISLWHRMLDVSFEWPPQIFWHKQ